MHIPLYELPAASTSPRRRGMGALRRGYRAAIAASLLAAGRDVVAVDDSFDEYAERAGLPILRGRLESVG